MRSATVEVTPSSIVIQREGLLSSSELTVDKIVTINPLWNSVVCVATTHADLMVTSDFGEVLASVVAGQSENPVLVYWWNRYSHQVSKETPLPPSPCRGGLLADEMVQSDSFQFIDSKLSFFREWERLL